MNVLMTGARGRIGTVLRRSLDLPTKAFTGDARRYAALRRQAGGCDAIIHLAWDVAVDNFDTNRADPQNLVMAQHVYCAALERGVRRVIVASSIHADMPRREPGGPRSPYRLPEPGSPYGANKVAVEAFGRMHALRHGLEVVCIRFGGVNPDANYRPDPEEPLVPGDAWLSHRDCAALVRAALTAPSFPDGYAIVYGVSIRVGVSVHDTRNPFGWQPMDEYEAKAGPGASARTAFGTR